MTPKLPKNNSNVTRILFPNAYAQRQEEQLEKLGVETNPTVQIKRNTKLNKQLFDLGWHEEVEHLVLQGANPNAKNTDGMTPAHNAALNGFVETIKTLHKLGADLNAKDNKGETPSHYAARTGRAEAIATLHSLGANLNAKDKDGWTPAELATKCSEHSTARLIAKLLAEKKKKKQTQ